MSTNKGEFSKFLISFGIISLTLAALILYWFSFQYVNIENTPNASGTCESLTTQTRVYRVKEPLPIVIDSMVKESDGNTLVFAHCYHQKRRVELVNSLFKEKNYVFNTGDTVLTDIVVVESYLGKSRYMIEYLPISLYQYANTPWKHD